MTTADAFLIVNFISTTGEGESSASVMDTGARNRTDDNGDGRTTALDALQVINYLQSQLIKDLIESEFVPSVQALISLPLDEDDDDTWLTLLAQDVAGITDELDSAKFASAAWSRDRLIYPLILSDTSRI